MEQVQQRSVEWYQQRLGRFTASEISRLLGKLTTQAGLKTFESYCMEKAIESVYGMIEDDYVSPDMQRGIDQEPYAFDKLWEILGERFINAGKAYFIAYGEHAGASPDGMSELNDVIEIKCPKPATFFKYCLTGDIPDNHYDQMQMQLLCTGGKKAYYFNYLTHMGEEYFHLKVVPRDNDRISLIEQRLAMAIELKLEYIEKLKSTVNYVASFDSELGATIIEKP